MELVVTLVAVPVVYLILLGLMPGRIRGVVTALVLIALTVTWTPVTPTGIRESAIFGSAQALLLVLTAKRAKKATGALLPILTVLFFVTGLLTTFFVFEDGIAGFLRIAVLGVLAAFVASQFSFEDRQIAIRGLLLAAVVQCGAGIAQYVTGTPPIWGFGRDSEGLAVVYTNPLLGEDAVRWQGTVGHPIPYAMVIVLALVAVLATRTTRRLGTTVVLVVGLVGTLLSSGTRTAMLAAVVALCYLFLLSGSQKHRFWSYLTAGVLVAGAFVLDFGLRSSVDELVASGSFTNRQDAISSVSKLMGRPLSAVLFGNGAGSEQSLFAAGLLQQNGFNVIDNQLVTTLATQGVLGAALLVAILTAALLSGDRAKRSLILVLIVMLFSFDYLRWPSMVVFAFVVIAMPAMARLHLPAQPKSPLPREKDLSRRVSGEWR